LIGINALGCPTNVTNSSGLESKFAEFLSVQKDGGIKGIKIRN